MNVKPKLKTTRVELRLTPEQKQALQDRATSAQLSMTDYIIATLQLPLPSSNSN